MKKLGYILVSVISLIPFLEVKGQDAFSMSTQYFSEGVPKAASKENHYGDIEGTPYLYDGWASGDVKLRDGKAYKDLYLKFDEVEGMVIFKYAMKDSAMVFAVPAVEFRFTYITGNKIYKVHFANGFGAGDGGNGDTFYQLLTSGETKLLKKTVKKILKRTEYGSTEVKRMIDETTTYYLTKGKQPIRIKNDNKSVLAFFNNSEQLKKYMADNKLNARNDDDFVKIIDYFNAI